MYSKIFACVVFFLAQGFSSGLLVNGYYWRVFDGEIPHDAFVAGRDVNGIPVYIGQVLHTDRLLPAKIYYNSNKAYYAWNTEMSTEKNIKILCAPYPERLKWVKTGKNEIHMLINKNIVGGGYDPNHTIYIGRAMYKSETVPGIIKAGDKAAQNLGLFISADGKQITFDRFEILTYEPDVEPIHKEYCHEAALFTQN